jgi:hypothetical protein
VASLLLEYYADSGEVTSEVVHSVSSGADREIYYAAGYVSCAWSLIGADGKWLLYGGSDSAGKQSLFRVRVDDQSGQD